MLKTLLIDKMAIYKKITGIDFLLIPVIFLFYLIILLALLTHQLIHQIEQVLH
jgi:hypothetical protein